MPTAADAAPAPPPASAPAVAAATDVPATPAAPDATGTPGPAAARVAAPVAAPDAAAAFRGPQGRNASYLMLNALVGAATGLLFWLVFARVLDVPASEVGAGYAAVALGTTIGVVAKGGLDTALLRHVPAAGTREGLRLLLFAILLGGLTALALAAATGFVAHASGGLRGLGAAGWATVAAIGALLVATWLQDAYFLADGDALPSLQRNLVFSGARLALPVPVLALTVAAPVATTWALALVLSAAVGALLVARRRPRDGRAVHRGDFLRSAARNVTGGAAESLPGLLLVPLVLHVEGPAAAAYFGIAWSAASLLFVACGAVGRSALAELVRGGAAGSARTLRHAMTQLGWLVLPAAAGGIVAAPVVLGLFGADYARAGAGAFMILCASTLFVAPAYLYLAVLRSQDRGRALVLFPLAMAAALLVLGPLLATPLGLEGVALGWLAANVPFGIYAAVRLVRLAKEVNPHGSAAAVGHPAHME